MLSEGGEHRLCLRGAEREAVGGDLDEALERSADAQVGALDLRQHLLQQLLVECRLPGDPERFSVRDVLVDLVDDSVGERCDVVEVVPERRAEAAWYGRPLELSAQGRRARRAARSAARGRRPCRRSRGSSRRR